MIELENTYERSTRIHTQVAVNFDIGKRTASQKQSGKKKSQGTSLDAQSVLCKLEGPKGTQ